MQFRSLSEAVSYTQKHTSTTLRVFAYEFDPNTVKRTFFVYTYSEFTKWFCSLQSTKRRVHELVPFEGPLKVFFDLETKKVESITEEDMGSIINSIRMLLPPEHEPLILNASRADKHSYHMVYPTLVLGNMHDIHILALFLLQKIPLLKDVLDEQVYKRRVGTMRTAYSTGFGKVCYINPIPHPPAAALKVDVDILLKSLIANVDLGSGLGVSECSTLVGGETEYLALKGNHQEQENCISTFSEPWGGWTPEELQEMRFSVLQELSYYGYKAVSDIKIKYKPEEDWANLSVAVKDVCCMNKGKIHQSNGTYLHIKLVPKPPFHGFLVQEQAPGEFFCADLQDCPRVSWNAHLDFGEALYGAYNSSQLLANSTG
jgi:hypothetical protein